jgi:hypothetical protein
MYGEVKRDGALSIEENAQKKFEAEYALALHMVEDPADSFHGIAGLFQRRVVNDEAAILALLPHALVSEYADETKLHVVQQPASVHGGACQHPVVTVLAIVKQFIEVLLVYGMNTLAVEPEQAQ